MRTFLILLVTIAVLFSFEKKYAAADDSPCWNKYNGRCQWTSEPCGRYDSAPLCGGPDNRQCCISGADHLCHTRYPNGRCQYTSGRCRGGYDGANLCGGGNNRQCCRRV